MRRATWASAASLLLFGGCAYAKTAVYKLHTDSSCKSAPTIIGFQESPPPSCSAITTCSSVKVDGEDLYWDRSCASKEYDVSSESLYGSKPYVAMEIYQSGGKCSKLLSGAAFLADGSCLATDNGVSSMKVSLFSDGSASFETYRGVSCSGTAVKISQVSKAALTSHSCQEGALKFYSSDATTTATATATTASTAGSDKTISTTTSHSAPRSFSESVLLAATLTATLAIAIALQ